MHYLQIAFIMLDSGARDLFGYSELHKAASNGDISILKSLLYDNSNVSDVNGKTTDGGYTPLHLAALTGHADCVEELISCNKVDICATDAFGRTPLETAKQSFKSDVVNLLQNYGRCLKVASPISLIMQNV